MNPPAAAAAAARRSPALWSLQARFAPFLFVAPFVVLFLVFTLWPVARSLKAIHATAVILGTAEDPDYQVKSLKFGGKSPSHNSTGNLCGDPAS